MKTHKSEAGIGLPEILVAMVVVSFVMAGVIGFFQTDTRASIQQGISSGLEASLRTGLRYLDDSFRNVGTGVPSSNLSFWVPSTWVTGFTANPTITVGGSSTVPDTVSLAVCNAAQPVTTLTAGAAVGDTTLTVSSTSGLNTTNKRLVSLDITENAQVTTVNNSTTLTIDTDPASGLQGLKNAYPAGTPLCLVRIDTYSVDSTNYRLMLNHNDGSGANILVDGIQNMKITVSNLKYQIVLTARSDRKDPATNAFVTRSMTSVVIPGNSCPPATPAPC
jgi:Tfp pilus assembly protein PilW